MILFSAKSSAVHDMHLDAVAEYAADNELTVSVRVYGLAAALAVVKSSDRVMFSQSTGLASLIVLPLARIRRKTIIHYMHEPTALRQKLQENPIIKSLVWHAVQWIEMRCASRVLVSRKALLDQAAGVYRVARDKISLAPLLMPRITKPHNARSKPRITYLGRIDERRFFQEFLQVSSDLQQRGFRPTVLTGDPNGFRRLAPETPPSIELFAEPNFSEALKSQILSETIALWNPKRGSIAQSGVTADAVRYGVAVLLTDKDPAYGTLLEKGIALDFEKAANTAFECLGSINEAEVSAEAASLFSIEHGRAAFEEAYFPLLA
ncbi:MAG: hypothetical protein AAFQ58_11185 [Pseudomonadota bacterium]